MVYKYRWSTLTVSNSKQYCLLSQVVTSKGSTLLPLFLQPQTSTATTTANTTAITSTVTTTNTALTITAVIPTVTKSIAFRYACVAA